MNCPVVITAAQMTKSADILAFAVLREKPPAWINVVRQVIVAITFSV
jgi:hypothetical protein